MFRLPFYGINNLRALPQAPTSASAGERCSRYGHFPRRFEFVAVGFLVHDSALSGKDLSRSNLLNVDKHAPVFSPEHENATRLEKLD